jgi:hypothetical protein
MTLKSALFQRAMQPTDYVTVAASTTQALSATGAIGNVLVGVLIVPGTVAAGAVTIKDGSGGAITIFAGGAVTALVDLTPFFVPLNAVSQSGGWTVITLANVTAIALGLFT